VFDFGGGFADGFSGLLGFDGATGELGEGCEGGGSGFGFDDGLAGGVDLFDGGFELLKLVGVDDGDELVKGELVVVAEVKGGDGGVEKIAGEVGGKGRRGRQWGR